MLKDGEGGLRYEKMEIKKLVDRIKKNDII